MCSTPAARRPGATRALLFFTDDPAEAERLSALPRPVLAGSVDHVREAVAGYVAIGLDELILPDFTLGSGAQKREALDRFREDVVAAVV